MIDVLLMKLIGGALVVAAISGSLYGGYQHVKGIGYDEAMVICAENTRKYEEKINGKIDKIEANATLLVTETRASNELLQTNVSAILKNTKGKTLTIIKNGECNPSQTFSDTFGNVNKRVNESMKGIKP